MTWKESHSLEIAGNKFPLSPSVCRGEVISISVNLLTQNVTVSVNLSINLPN